MASQRPALAQRLRPANSFSAIRMKMDRLPALPQPEVLSRNGSYIAYLRIEEHVGAFRDFLRQHGDTPEEQEWVAAKLMGRWREWHTARPLTRERRPGARSGPAAHQRFQLRRRWTPTATPVRLGAHIRRMNPRDTAANMQRRKMIRRGGTYGPPCPKTSPTTASNEASPHSSAAQASSASSNSQ